MKSYLNDRLRVHAGDNTESKVAAMEGGGVEGAIQRKGSHRYPEGLPAGKALVSTETIAAEGLG